MKIGTSNESAYWYSYSTNLQPTYACVEPRPDSPPTGISTSGRQVLPNVGVGSQAATRPREPRPRSGKLRTRMHIDRLNGRMAAGEVWFDGSRLQIADEWHAVPCYRLQHPPTGMPSFVHPVPRSLCPCSGVPKGPFTSSSHVPIPGQHQAVSGVSHTHTFSLSCSLSHLTAHLISISVSKLQFLLQLARNNTIANKIPPRD